MTIAFVSSMNSVPWGGSEILWYETAEKLAIDGHRLAICTPPWPQIPPPLCKAKIQWNAHHTFEITNQPRRLTKRISSRFFRRSDLGFQRRWLRQFKPKLLCISNGNAYQGLNWMEAAMSEAVPFVTIAQAHAEFICPGEADAQRLMKGFSAARTNYFVARANLAMVEAQLGWQLPNARFIGNHSRHLLTTAPFPWPTPADQSIRLACVARLHLPSKGQDLLFEVLSHPRWSDRDLHVSLFGSGGHEQALRRLAQLLGISHRIHFRGHTSDPNQIWATHHALILPSRYEGMPLVLMEAMLAGRPVISTAVAGAPELISHRETGFLAEAPTALHLQNCLEEAWSLRSEWRSIGHAAHVRAANRAQIAPADHLAKEMLDLVL